MIAGGLGCQQKSESKVAAGAAASAEKVPQQEPPRRPAVEPIKPSIDVKTPPPDAVKLPSGMIYKRLTVKEGPTPSRNDVVVIHFTGWKTTSGETFNTTRSRGKPMPLDLATAGPGFADVFTQVHKGETVMMWMPSELVNQTGQRDGETLAFEAELVDIEAAPPVPPDVAAPPANAKATKSGVRYLVVAPGTGAERARSFDTVKYRYTLWDATGKMLGSTEKRSRPVSSVVYRQPQPLADVMTTMVVGERVRFWTEGAKLADLRGGLPEGPVCYELELTEITKGTPPPQTPKDVKAPPPGTKQTASGVWYRVLKRGKGGAHPAPTDTVEVHYSGWTTDGRMFDSSVARGAPAKFPLNGVIKGWTDGIPLMQVGEVTRFWIPEELAYKGAPNQPKGMLVFDVELLAFSATSAAGHGGPHGTPHGAHAGDDH